VVDSKTDRLNFASQGRRRHFLAATAPAAVPMGKNDPRVEV